MRHVIRTSIAVATALFLVGLVAEIASAKTVPAKPQIAFVSPSPAAGATTSSAVSFKFTYNRTPKQTASVTCALVGPTASSGPCADPTASGSGSQSGIDYTGLASGAYTFTVTVTLTDGGAASATRSFTVQPPGPNVTTTATPGGNASPGSAQHDVANVAAPPSQPTPGGTITFSLCGPAQVTANGCPAGSGAQIGSPVTIAAGSATSSNVNTAASPLSPGTYCWRADYTPDAPSAPYYGSSSHTDAVSECFKVVKAEPTMSTQIAITGNGVLGTTDFGDQANLTGFFGSPGAGEVVTFNLYGPYAAAIPTCVGPPTFTTTGALSGSGGTAAAVTAATFTPTQAGTYVWVATYSGNTFNTPAVDSCGAVKETGVVIST
jgi:hypothetical protein